MATEHRTAQELEAYVRARWMRAYVRFPTHSYANETWEYQLEYTTKDGFQDADAAWQAAYDYTVELERKIAEVEEQIVWLDHCREFDKDSKWRGILAARQAALADLQRGLREPAQGKDAE